VFHPHPSSGQTDAGLAASCYERFAGYRPREAGEADEVTPPSSLPGCAMNLRKQGAVINEAVYFCAGRTVIRSSVLPTPRIESDSAWMKPLIGRVRTSHEDHDPFATPRTGSLPPQRVPEPRQETPALPARLCRSIASARSWACWAAAWARA
jgi:hypothetical protein